MCRDTRHIESLGAGHPSHSRGRGVDITEMSIRALLEVRDKPKSASDIPQFDASDAGHVQKLLAMAVRDTENGAPNTSPTTLLIWA